MKNPKEILREYEDKVLDQHYKTFPFWTQFDATSLYCLLAGYDSLAFVPELLPHKHTASSVQLRKRFEDGFAQAVRWLMTAKKCDHLTPISSYSKIHLAHEFIYFGADYVDIADLHKSLNRGLATVEIDEDCRKVRFDILSDSQGIFGGACYHESLHAECFSVSKRKQNIRHAGLVTPVETSTLRHTYKDGRIQIHDFTALTNPQFINSMKAAWPETAIELPNETDLAGFTAGELTDFWAALSVWSKSCCELFLDAILKGNAQYMHANSSCRARRICGHDK